VANIYSLIKHLPKIVNLWYNNKKLSTCAYTQVSAILTTYNGHILSTGYNGSPSGKLQCNEYDILLQTLFTILKTYDNFKQWLEDLKRSVNNELAKISKDDMFELNEDIVITTNVLEDICNLVEGKVSEMYEQKILELRNKYWNTDIGKILLELFELTLKKLEQDKVKYLNKSKIFRRMKRYNVIHNAWEIHAEINALYIFNKYHNPAINEPLVLFSTHSPCIECSKTLSLNLPINLIIYKHRYIDSKYGFDSTIIPREYEMIQINEFLEKYKNYIINQLGKNEYEKLIRIIDML